MLKSYLLTAWRNLCRNKVSSLINIGGLAMGLALGIVILLYVLHMAGYDRFHAHLGSIFLVETNETISGNVETTRATPAPLGPAIRQAMPVCQYVARTTGTNSKVVRYKDKLLYQDILAVEPDFFRIMTFPAVEGDPRMVLQDGNSVVLTQAMARRLFGSEKALGKTILLNNQTPLKVGAVIRDVPINSTIRFDALTPYSLFEKDLTGRLGWENNDVLTWVRLRPGADVATLNQQLTRLLQDNRKGKSSNLFAYPFGRINLYSHFINGKEAGGKIYLVAIIAALAALVLLVSCVNFMNLSTAMADRRAREVGLRKVLGASRPRIIAQFLGEAVLTVMIALVLAIGLARLTLPWFMGFANEQLDRQFGTIQLWICLLILGLITGLIAGSYPALYMSRFPPLRVMKKSIRLGNSSGRLRKTLVTGQFVVSVFVILGVVVCFQQIEHEQNRPIGYSQAGLLDIGAQGILLSRYGLFKEAVEALPGVRGVTAASSDMINISGSVSDISWPGKRPGDDYAFNAIRVQPDWLRTTGISLAEGRFFDQYSPSDTGGCLVNQAAIRRMGLKEPIVGTRLGDHTIIGVVRDFVYQHPALPTRPLVIYTGGADLTHFLVRLADDGQGKATLAHIERIARSLEPSYPFTCRYTDEQYRRLLTGDDEVLQLFNIFGVITIFISCLGLFGLAGFLVERRTKDISIRRVLGATTTSLWVGLSREVLKPVFVGYLIATPLGILVFSKLLAGQEYRAPLYWWMFALAGLGILLLALATVSYHGIRAARINPAQSLKEE